MPWDWTIVTEIALGISVGLGIGGWVIVGFVRGLAYELLSNPTVQQFARAAENLGKTGEDGKPWWAGLLIKIGEKLGVLDGKQ